MYACLLTCLGFLLSGYLRMNILFQPNFLELFFWTLNSYLVVRLIQTDCKNIFTCLEFLLLSAFFQNIQQPFIFFRQSSLSC